MNWGIRVLSDHSDFDIFNQNTIWGILYFVEAPFLISVKNSSALIQHEVVKRFGFDDSIEHRILLPPNNFLSLSVISKRPKTQRTFCAKTFLTQVTWDLYMH